MWDLSSFRLTDAMKTVTLLLLLVGQVACTNTSAFSPKVNPLPKPVKSTWSGDGAKVLASTIQFTSNSSSELLINAWNRAYDTVVDLQWSPAAVEAPFPSYEAAPNFTFPSKTKRSSLPPLTTINIGLSDDVADLQQGVDESYTLVIGKDSNTIQITAKTVWGAMHAITTFQQLIIVDSSANHNATDPDASGLIVEGPVVIEDKPQFPYRGLMLDSGRNFLSIKKLKEQIDAMALAKLNVLHWHLSDSTSWPMHIAAYPEMVDDCYSPRESYTQSDLINLVAYAKARGVRIVPELDMPAHASAGWKRVDPNIVACADTFWADTAGEPSPGQLEILNNKTYEVVKNVRNELIGIFPELIQHIGGDEINTACYNYSYSTQKWFAEDSSRDYSDLLQYWVDHIVPIARSLRNGTRVMMWEDILDAATAAHSVPKDVILQIWLGGPDIIKNITSSGYDVIVSSADYLYLDCGFGGFLTNDPGYDMTRPNPTNGGSWCSFVSWQKIYNMDVTANLTAEEKKHVLGGSVNLWSEQVDDTVVTGKAWPRAAAFGELMWNGNRDLHTGQKRTSEFTQRLLNFREYLVSNHISAGPVVPKYCVIHPHACDVSANQSIVT